MEKVMEASHEVNSPKISHNFPMGQVKLSPNKLSDQPKAKKII